MVGIICNPTAGNGLAVKVGKKITEILASRNIAFKQLNTEAPGHAVQLAHSLAESGCERILSVGGDGTVSEIASALAGRKTPLGIIPAGTGNDFIKSLHYPKDPVEALDYVYSHEPKLVDIGHMNEKMFINEIGTGFDVKVLEYAEKAKKYVKGLLPYLHGVLCTLVHYKPTRLTYQIEDEQPVTEDVLVCAVANGGVIGGGIPIVPGADPQDGLLDVVIIRDVPKRKLPLYVPKLLAGKILSFPETVQFKVRKIKFSAPDMKVNADGEILAVPSVSASIQTGAVYVFC